MDIENGTYQIRRGLGYTYSGTFGSRWLVVTASSRMIRSCAPVTCLQSSIGDTSCAHSLGISQRLLYMISEERAGASSAIQMLKG